MEWIRLQQVLFTQGPSAVVWLVHCLIVQVNICTDRNAFSTFSGLIWWTQSIRCGLLLHVCVFATLMYRYCAKTAEPTEMPFGSDSRGPEASCIRWGRARDPLTGMGISGGCPARSAAEYASKGIIYSSIIALLVRLLQLGVMLHCFHEKSASPEMQLFVKILWPLVVTDIVFPLDNHQVWCSLFAGPFWCQYHNVILLKADIILHVLNAT